MTDFVVRPATLADVDSVARVRVATWRHAYAGLIPDNVLAGLDPVADAEFFRTNWPSDPAVLARQIQVAERAGEIVGFVRSNACRPSKAEKDPDPAPDALGVGEIYAIYVLPEHQGHGVGARLVDAAVSALASRRLAPVVLWVLAENWPSRRFYERVGFAYDGGIKQLELKTDLPEPIEVVRYVRH
jgi:ribosomal protein S18 acetylase RimI-like enzyme